MAKKRIQKIPSSVMLTCPHCSKRSRALVSTEICPQKFTCPKCNNEVNNPMSSCCIICAFSKTKCPRNLLMEAKIKKLEIR